MLAAAGVAEMVTHPSTNRARSCLTSVIEPRTVAPYQRAQYII